MNPDSKANKVRDILGCMCSFGEEPEDKDYDGKSYNLKTEKYEDCSCVDQLAQLFDLIKAEVIGMKDPNIHDNLATENQNHLREFQTKKLDELFKGRKT